MAINILSSDTLLECLKEQAADLGEQGVNLFRSGLSKSKSDLIESYIRPNLLSPGTSYIYIAGDKGGKGSRRAYDPGNTLVATKVPPGDDLAFPGRWGLFTNPLAWIDINAPGPRPSDRAINIGFTCYTLEFDKIPLSQQLRAIWSGGLRRTDDILQCFRDYRGYEVIYGGGKSLHFHFIFDLRHWNHDLAFANNSSYQNHWLADFPDDYLREAHEDRWDVVGTAFHRATGLENPDASLRFWEQNRRVPLALRVVGEDHPLELPPGSYVRQYVLASSVRQNIPRRGKGWFHHSDLVGRSAVRYFQRHAKRNHFDPSQANGGDQASDDEQQRFHKFLAENFPKLTIGSDLSYARVEFGSQGPKLYLFNDADDQTPSSIIQGDYNSVLLQGHHELDGKTYRLGVSPNQLFEVMVEQDARWMDPDDHALSRMFEAEVRLAATLPSPSISPSEWLAVAGSSIRAVASLAAGSSRRATIRASARSRRRCETEVCKRALTAARQAQANVAALADSAMPGLRFGLALHIGEVLYGNIGSGNRLDFTCIGPAVNCAARIEKLTSQLRRAILASGEFVRHCPGEFTALGEFSLAGFSAPQLVFGLADEAVRC